MTKSSLCKNCGHLMNWDGLRYVHIFFKDEENTVFSIKCQECKCKSPEYNKALTRKELDYEMYKQLVKGKKFEKEFPTFQSYMEVIRK